MAGHFHGEETVKTIGDVESAICVLEWYEGSSVGAESACQVPFGNGAGGTTVEADDLRVIFCE